MMGIQAADSDSIGERQTLLLVYKHLRSRAETRKQNISLFLRVTRIVFFSDFWIMIQNTIVDLSENII
jgi:hypothetical protein